MVTIESLDKAECTGCYGCFNVCPNDSISFQRDSHGFLYPSVNLDTCIDCSLCVDVCPVLSPVKEEGRGDPLTYAAWSIDEVIRKTSSSGGVFSEMANIILKNRGVVYGASFDVEFNLFHVKITEQSSLYQIRGSKYVQSQINGVFKEIVLMAQSEIPVLFCGTPCQVSALKNIISINNVSSHVFTCDLICHGVASQRVFNSYMDYMAETQDSRIVGYDFRDKSVSWDKYGTKMVFENGKTVFNQHLNDPFMLGYLRNYYIRPSCHNCKFCKIPRNSDLTLGDYWGVPKKMYDPLGVSVIVSNNEFGDSLLKQNRNIQKTQINLNEVARGNPRLVTGNLKIPAQLSRFNTNFNKDGFKGVINEFLRPTPPYIMVMLKIKNLMSNIISKYIRR